MISENLLESHSIGKVPQDIIYEKVFSNRLIHHSAAWNYNDSRSINYVDTKPYLYNGGMSITLSYYSLKDKSGRIATFPYDLYSSVYLNRALDPSNVNDILEEFIRQSEVSKSHAFSNTIRDYLFVTSRVPNCGDSASTHGINEQKSRPRLSVNIEPKQIFPHNDENPLSSTQFVISVSIYENGVTNDKISEFQFEDERAAKLASKILISYSILTSSTVPVPATYNLSIKEEMNNRDIDEASTYILEFSNILMCQLQKYMVSTRNTNHQNIQRRACFDLYLSTLSTSSGNRDSEYERNSTLYELSSGSNLQVIFHNIVTANKIFSKGDMTQFPCQTTLIFIREVK